MKKILYGLVGILMLSCVQKPETQNTLEVGSKSEMKLVDIKFDNSRDKAIEKLELIWGCEDPIIAKNETNLNGEIWYSITLLISDFKPIDEDKKEENYKLTADLIKKEVLNYKEFSVIKMITSFTSAKGEKITASKTIKTTDL